MAVTSDRIETRRYRDPSWWNRDYDNAWDRAKEAFRRDWEQTKHDFGADAPDLKQDVGDTVAQATGRQPMPAPYQPSPEGKHRFEEYEPAYRFGYGARRYYGSRYSEWNDDLETRLREDWKTTGAVDEDWDRYQPAIRRGWGYEGDIRE